MKADGSHQRQLTHDASEAFQPGWSPSGKQIAFASSRDGDNEIFKMKADGSNQRQLTHNTLFSDREPSYSPSGKQIAFDSGRDGDNEIFKMKADGSNQRQLTDNAFNDFFRD
jgi:TolB protein